MDKSAIKKFAVWARTELIARVTLKGVEYGITEDNIEDANADSVGGKVLTADEKKQRQALIAEINDKGYKQVMEEVAYTWFNRFSALRFMEVNGYLPSHVRVFTDEENNFKPQIITEAIHLDLDGLDMEKVYEMKDAEKTEELYKYLLIVQCNALNKILPGMFQKIADYTELLLPDNLLREGSVIQQMIELIPEDDWKDAVQIIGWLYQYYIAEPKNELINARKQYKDAEISLVTQLFTSDWIVRYMVENSLGRLWLEGHPDDKIYFLPTEDERIAYATGKCVSDNTKWYYYLEDAEQEVDVLAQFTEIRREYATLTPNQLRVIDPCVGSGHILAYMFDVLMKIYESYGYAAREAVASIVENNLYGLDIDDRAAQLAYFAVMMKARQYDRRFFSRGIQPHVYAIVESNHVDKFAVDYFCNGDMKLTTIMDTIIKELHDAKEYGSILNVTQQDWSALYERFAEITEEVHMFRDVALRELLPLLHVAETLAQKYDVVATNPPYMNSTYMPTKLKNFVIENYPDFKNDLFSVFFNVVINMSKANGHIGILMPYVWMFISSYEKMRKWLNKTATITTLVQLEYNAFEAACVPVAALTLVHSVNELRGQYIKLSEFKGANNQKPKTLEAIIDKKCTYKYTVSQKEFQKIPGTPFAYWINKQFINLFVQETSIKEISRARSGAKTGNNELFLKCWWEIDFTSLSTDTATIEECEKANFKWFPHNKGGVYQNWYGNRELVIRFERAGSLIKENGVRTGASYDINAKDVYFHEGITWTALTSSKNSFRYSPVGCVFDSNKGPMMFPKKDDIYYLLALLISPVAQMVFKILNPSMSLQNGDVDKLPVILVSDKKNQIGQMSRENVEIVRHSWDSFETSWDFTTHPLITYRRGVNYAGIPIDKCQYRIADSYDIWERNAEAQFELLKKNEEELNCIFIDIYGLQDELTSKVEDKDVSVRKADLGRDIRSFISYAVGCMFGRYSLDVNGLAYAGGEWDASKYVSFDVDKDNIIPICDDEYFEDDIVGLFVEFVKTVYGADTLDENLKFISDALGGKGQPKDVIRNYFLSDFYSDHCKIYQKRPIYWLFDSGKKNGFKALIYMHRYQPDTIARIRTDYVHEQQARYRTAIADLEQRIANASTGERVKLNKKLTTLQAQDTEIRTYEEKIHHLADQMISIDLDDGVKKNYAIFQDVLAKIK